MNSAQRRLRRWQWIAKHLDFLFLVPWLLFVGVVLVGWLNPMAHYKYLSIAADLSLVLGLATVSEFALQRKRGRYFRLAAFLILLAVGIYTHANYPAFGGVF